MTEEKFEKFQGMLQLAIAWILLMEEDGYVIEDGPLFDADCLEYTRKATKRVKEDKNFAKNIKLYTDIIATMVRDVFKEE